MHSSCIDDDSCIWNNELRCIKTMNNTGGFRVGVVLAWNARMHKDQNSQIHLKFVESSVCKSKVIGKKNIALEKSIQSSMCCPIQIKHGAGCILGVYVWDSMIRKWHYGNSGITMKRAASGMLRATFYREPIISQPAAFCSCLPYLWVTPQPANTSSDLLFILFSQKTAASYSWIFPSGSCLTPLIIQPISQSGDNLQLPWAINKFTCCMGSSRMDPFRARGGTW